MVNKYSHFLCYKVNTEHNIYLPKRYTSSFSLSSFSLVNIGTAFPLLYFLLSTTLMPSRGENQDTSVTKIDLLLWLTHFKEQRVAGFFSTFCFYPWAASLNINEKNTCPMSDFQWNVMMHLLERIAFMNVRRRQDAWKSDIWFWFARKELAKKKCK